MDQDPHTSDDDASGLKRARRVASILAARDATIQQQGIEVIEAAPGRATVRMTVTALLTNAIGVCHGGYVFLLADTAFALAANSYNQYAVSASASIEFLAPARVGDRLLAHAGIIEQRGRQAWFDLRVEIENGPRIALGRARAVTVEGRYYEEDAP